MDFAQLFSGFDVSALFYAVLAWFGLKFFGN